MYGNRCFKCGGSGHQLTKRGAVAQAFLDAMTTKEAIDLKVGDVVLDEYLAGTNPAARWATIKSLSINLKGSVGQPYGPKNEQGRGMYVCWEPQVEIVSGSGTHIQFSISSKVRTRATEEQKAQALAYQANLTKAGTERKARAA